MGAPFYEHKFVQLYSWLFIPSDFVNDDSTSYDTFHIPSSFKGRIEEMMPGSFCVSLMEWMEYFERAGRLLNVLCTFNLRPMSTGNILNCYSWYCLSRYILNSILSARNIWTSLYVQFVSTKQQSKLIQSINQFSSIIQFSLWKCRWLCWKTIC